MGWQETVVDRHKEHVGGPIEYQDVETMRHQIKDEIDRVRRRLNAAKTGVSFRRLRARRSSVCSLGQDMGTPTSIGHINGDALAQRCATATAAIAAS